MNDKKETRELILAYDLGTTGAKACLFDFDGQMVFRTFCEYQTFFSGNSRAEQDPEAWWQSVTCCTRKLWEAGFKTEAVQVIGISGHMMNCLPVDSRGFPLRYSIIHSDRRSETQCDNLTNSLGVELIYKTTGNRFDPRYPVCKILWLKENEPDIYEKTYKFLQSKEYLIFKLTGVMGYTDYSDASLAGVLDIRKKKFARELLSEAGIDWRKLTEPVPSTTIVGKIHKEAAKQLGLMENTPVIIGGGDGACASVGAGAVDKGEAYCYLGSTSWINVATDVPRFDPKMRIFHLYSLDPDILNLGGGIQSAGSAYQWVKNQLGQVESSIAEQLERSPYEFLDKAAASVEPGSAGIIFLPYLMGEKTPIWDHKARGVFFGLSLRHTKNHLIRSVLEGVGFALRSVIDVFSELGVDITTMDLTGGGAKGELWPKILANAFNKPVLINTHANDAPAFGAAIAAGVGYGLHKNFSAAKSIVKTVRRFEPELVVVERYAQLYGIYRNLYNQLKPSFHQLAEIEC